MERKNTYCLDCGIHLSGRVDKKFCSSICRTSYHNSKNKSKRIGTSYGKIAIQLRINRKILSELYKSGNHQVTLKDLRKKKFAPELFTGLHKKTAQETIFHCFDFHFKINEKEELVFIYKE